MKKKSASSYFDKRYRLLTQQEEIDLAKRIEQGDLTAKEILIECNHRLVVLVAKRYRRPELVQSFDDLIQEGEIGLIKAANTYDRHSGFRFSTHAVPYIRQAINDAIEEKDRTVRLPKDVYQTVRSMDRFVEKHLVEFGCEPNLTQVANHFDLTEKRAQELLNWIPDVFSLDQPARTSMEGNSTVGDRQINLSSQTEEEALANISCERWTSLIKSNLCKRDQEILSRSGFFDGTPRTLEEVGNDLNMTRERVRQLEFKAREKLKRVLVFESVKRNVRLKPENLLDSSESIFL